MLLHLSKLIASLIILMASSYVSAQVDPEGLNCTGSQPEMNACAVARFKTEDDELNRLYQRQLGRLSSATTKARFRAAQRAWLTFRDKACLYEAGPVEESGTLWAIDQFGSLEYHTKHRIEDMKIYLRCESNGCPN